MKDRNDSGTRPDAADALLERLFETVEPRPAPPPAQTAFVRERLTVEWEGVVQRRRRRHRLVGFAAAASVAVVAALMTVLFGARSTPEATLPIAQIERIAGAVWLEREGTRETVRDGAALLAGATIATTDGRAALAIAGLSLRLDRDTSLTVTAGDRVALAAGAVYVDTGRDGPGAPELQVETALGTVSHVGTQYLVRVDPLALTARVRSGEVLVTVAGDRVAGQAGEELILDADGIAQRRTVPVHGPSWDWVGDLAPAFDAEGRTIDEFLDWVGRETGLEIRFRSADARAAAIGSRLRGTVDLAPLRALEAVLLASDLHAEVVGDTIVVDLATAD